MFNYQFLSCSWPYGTQSFGYLRHGKSEAQAFNLPLHFIRSATFDLARHHPFL